MDISIEKFVELIFFLKEKVTESLQCTYILEVIIGLLGFNLKAGVFGLSWIFCDFEGEPMR